MIDYQVNSIGYYIIYYFFSTFNQRLEVLSLPFHFFWYGYAKVSMLDTDNVEI